MTAERNKTRADLLARLWGPGVYPVEYARALVNPLRHLICPAWLIVRRLQVKPTDRVLEIGSGPGYFSPSVARRLTEGRLTLYDVQIGMLEMAAKRLERCGCGNFECRAGDAASLPFPDRAFDLAFMVAVLGEVSDRAAAMGGAGAPARRPIVSDRIAGGSRFRPIGRNAAACARSRSRLRAALWPPLVLHLQLREAVRASRGPRMTVGRTQPDVQPARRPTLTAQGWRYDQWRQ
jgi:SAM-dependent methyltransferase